MNDLRSTSFQGVKLRRVRQEDYEQIFRVFIDSRSDLVKAIVDWDNSQQLEFMQFQYNTQLEQYHKQYFDVRFDAITENDEIIGILYIAILEKEIRLLDIVLLRKHRNRGIGYSLLLDLLDESTLLQKPVKLHVQQGNPAFHLYQRLGFIEFGDQEIFRAMQWTPLSFESQQKVVS